jgi:hypothetical protein
MLLKTDLALLARIPVVITRSYRSSESFASGVRAGAAA